MKILRAVALMLILCLTLPFMVGFIDATGEATGAGCSTEDIQQYVPDVIDFSREVVAILRIKHPDRLPSIDEYLGYAEDFYQGWQQGEAEGMARLPALLKSFQTTIRPLLDPNNTALQIAAAGLDFALRKFARRWEKIKERIQESDVQVAVAKTTAKAKGINLESADKTVESFLREPRIEKPKK